MIYVVDYGLGNVQAFINLYKRLGIGVERATNSKQLLCASKIVLPGVGAFDHAMTQLEKSGMRDTLNNLVINDFVPILGVCVGMQMLANSSEEGVLPGLGWINGKVRSFRNNEASSKLPMPHMGWNDVNTNPKIRLFNGMEGDARFYFLHSYYFECEDEESSVSGTEYGFSFCSVVSKKNIFGVQFHPEKSHHWGVSLLRNFAEV